jgi:hypothetical protein
MIIVYLGSITETSFLILFLPKVFYLVNLITNLKLLVNNLSNFESSKLILFY